MQKRTPWREQKKHAKEDEDVLMGAERETAMPIVVNWNSVRHSALIYTVSTRVEIYFERLCLCSCRNWFRSIDIWLLFMSIGVLGRERNLHNPEEVEEEKPLDRQPQ